MNKKTFLKLICLLLVLSPIAIRLYNYLVITNSNDNFMNEKVPLKVELKSKIIRNLSRNYIRDYSVDATCTLPYVSRSCFNLIADYIYDDKVKNVEPVSQLKSGDVIMVSTNLCQHFFQHIFPRITCYIILISHYGDNQLESKFTKYLEDKRLIVWFATNPGFHHLKLVPMPIGFEDTVWNPKRIKYIRNVNLSSLIPWQRRKNLVYINFEVRSHSSRENLRNVVRNFPNVLIEHKVNYADYLKSLGNSKYVFCPRL
jgi:hypothetical protein